MEIRERTKVSDEKLDQVLVILKKCTDVEHKITRYIERNGGIIRCLEQDSTMQELVAISENRIGNPLPSIFFPTTSGVAFGGDFYRTRQPRSPVTVPPYEGNVGEYTSRRRRNSYNYGTQTIPPVQPTFHPGPYSNRLPYSGSYYQPLTVPYLQPDGTSPYPPPPLNGIEENPSSSQVIMAQYRREIVYALNTGVDTLLHNHTVTWRLKMDYQTTVIHKEIQLNADRIIQRMDAGPHERILDPYFREIWATEVSIILSPLLYWGLKPGRNGEDPSPDQHFSRRFMTI